jgi:hypothetical protein
MKSRQPVISEALLPDTHAICQLYWKIQVNLVTQETSLTLWQSIPYEALRLTLYMQRGPVRERRYKASSHDQTVEGPVGKWQDFLDRFDHCLSRPMPTSVASRTIKSERDAASQGDQWTQS